MSLRTRILLLVLLATLVPAAIWAYVLAGDRGRAVAEAQEKLQAAGRLIADDLHDAVRSTAQLEYGLARARDLDTGDRAACSNFLAGVLKEHPQYTGLLTIRPDGTLFCDSLRSGRALQLQDRRYFREAMAPKARLALEPTFGRLTGKAVMQIASPARDEAGAVKFVLLASLDLERLMRGRARSVPYETAVLVLMDGNGVVLTWHPESEVHPGTSLVGGALHRLAQQRDGGDGHARITSGNVDRVWVVAAPNRREYSGADLAVLVGVSRSELTAAAERRLNQALAIVAVVSLLAFIVAWALAEAGIRRPIKRMMDAMARIGAGDMRARIGAPYAHGELGSLMRSLDATADVLEKLNTELERRVAERTVQLETANQDLESFSYSVSHDLRTPLRAIDGFARTLVEDHAATLDDEGRRLLGVVCERARRMGVLIDELLDFSRLRHRPFAASALDMEALARGALEEVVVGAGGAPQVRCEIGPLPAASGDPTLIRQVWVNLLSNALKFSGKSPDPSVMVSGALEGAELVYCVKDNGAGFDMRYYDKLFGVFQRLHRVEEFPGTGVGLAIVQRAVLRHGGRVWAESLPGQGAAFYFSLPVP
jgi:signal transduction histidine kinase